MGIPAEDTIPGGWGVCLNPTDILPPYTAIYPYIEFTILPNRGMFQAEISK